jgi:hypothetical protein
LGKKKGKKLSLRKKKKVFFWWELGLQLVWGRYLLVLRYVNAILKLVLILFFLLGVCEKFEIWWGYFN